MMSDDDRTYDDAVEIERHLGRKHTRAELRKLRAALKNVYKYGDEREFMQFLRGIGLKDDRPTSLSWSACSALCGPVSLSSDGFEFLYFFLRYFSR
jgi:hypothetical protein